MYYFFALYISTITNIKRLIDLTGTKKHVVIWFIILVFLCLIPLAAPICWLVLLLKKGKIITPKKIQFSKQKYAQILVILLPILLFVLVKNFWEIRYMTSVDMGSTLTKNDRLVINKKDIETPQRGDMVIFYPIITNIDRILWGKIKHITGLGNKDTVFLKRVIGLPNEKIEIKETQDNRYIVIIDGKKLDEPYILSDRKYTKCEENMFCGPITIPDGEYF